MEALCARVISVCERVLGKFLVHTHPTGRFASPTLFLFICVICEIFMFFGLREDTQALFVFIRIVFVILQLYSKQSLNCSKMYLFKNIFLIENDN